MTSPRPPSTIGPFKIERELGRGGMGEVFLARDSRLDRQVAIKAIPAHMAADADRLARFQREAKVLASLNHPNIGAIYGLEESVGEAGAARQYLVLEYIEGETLSDRLAGGAIPLGESLAIARQIAEALEVAHEKGIVHRDLKPGNIMVTEGGVAKVLDFGLARTAEGTPSSANFSASLADSPTITTPAARAPRNQPVHSPTVPGVIMGSAGYMSPEQARGKPVDKRSDIFSFGCVLYEMLSGEQPFGGETTTDALGAILHREPDWSRLPPATPPIVQRLLRRCLAKDKNQRLRDMGDARMEIEQAIADPRADPSGIASALQSPAPNRAWWSSPSVLVSAVLLAIASGLAAYTLRSVPPTPQAIRAPIRAELTLPEGLSLLQGDRSIAVSPDGTLVVVAAFRSGTAEPSALYLRDLSRLDFRRLEGTETGTYPFWSPDGRSIAFFSNGKLKRLDIADNFLRNICDAPAGRGGSWGRKGTIVFAPGATGGLMLVSDSGGTPTPATTAKGPAESHRNPCFLPDGERFLHVVANVEEEGAYIFDPAVKQSRLVLEGRAEAVYVEPGYLAYVRDKNLMVQPFDPVRLELTGTATPIAADIGFDVPRAFINAGIARDGTLVYQPVARLPRLKLAWMDLKGQQTPIPAQPLAMAFAALSADARRAAFETQGDRGEDGVAVVDLDRGITTAIEDPKARVLYGACILPDGQRVIVSGNFGSKQDILSYPVGGGNPTKLLEGDGSEYGINSISPDAKTLVFTRTPGRDKAGDIMTMDLTADPPTVKTFLETPVPEWIPTLSPGADALLFMVEQEPSRQDSSAGLLKAVTFPTPGIPVQVSPSFVRGLICWTGPNEACWVDMQRRVWSAEVTLTGTRIDVGPPKPMFEGRPLDEGVRLLDFDIAKQRFLVGVREETNEEPRLIIVSDWRPAPSAAKQPASN